MSVPVHERKESRLEVFHHWLNVRQNLINEIIFDFGFSKSKQERKLKRRLGIKEEKDVDELSAELYDRLMAEGTRMRKFEEWMIYAFRYRVLDHIFSISSNLVRANAMYPTTMEEYYLRADMQSLIIADLYALIDTMHIIIFTLSSDVNRFPRHEKALEKEIHLVKKWKKNDKERYKKANLPYRRGAQISLNNTQLSQLITEKRLRIGSDDPLVLILENQLAGAREAG